MREAPESETPARFVVGIDLGTTNTAVAFADLRAKRRKVEIFRIAQLTAPGEIERRDTLPSFHLEPAPGQFDAAALRLPWERGLPATVEAAREIIGVLARDRGADAPGRLIASAKSWLSHSGVDRTADLLPWHGADGVRKLSPAEVSARYLRHVRAAWNDERPEHPLETQDVIITIPASFDEVARGLTVEAARRAGLRRVVLIEEPQAAFYTWMNTRGTTAADGGSVSDPPLNPGEIVLVCDIGGGTSDFTLIEVGERAGADTPGAREYRRFAVGDHLILGGDNLDLTLAHFVEARLGAPLDPRPWSVLVRHCQQAKETLLGANAPERLTLSVGAGGARLIGGARQVELTRAEVATQLVDGFVPYVPPDAPLARHQSGFREFGLPFAPDPAITRHLAAFLRREPPAGGRTVNGLVRPDAVLLNGGFFESPALRDRLLAVLGEWFGPDGKPRLLENRRLDLAVAEGAVYFGLARRGEGARITGGLARAYYLGVAGPAGDAHALCLAPAGMAEEEQADLPVPLELLIRQPVEFPLYASTFRTGDVPGDLVPLGADDPREGRAGAREFTQLPPVRTALQGRAGPEGADRIQVQLHARLSAVGTLDIWCSEIGGRQRQWKLPFDVRASADADEPRVGSQFTEAASLEEAVVTRCRERIRETFAAGGSPGTAAVETLVKRLEADCGLARLDWPPSLLRSLWEELMAAEPARARSSLHEARWLNLLGFSLRPGFGFPVDDWRAAQSWRLYERRLAHPKNELCRAEWWIFWRRIAGGLTAGQQRALAAPLLAGLTRAQRSGGATTGRPAAAGGVEGSHETAEIWRLLGSLEWLLSEVKTEFGRYLLDQLDSPSATAEKVADRGRRKAAIWALARLGARVPLHGPLNTLVDPEAVQGWLGRLTRLPERDEEISFAVMQLARRTGDRFRDVPATVREMAVAWMLSAGSPARHVELVRTGGELEKLERDTAFGERLPLGLRVAFGVR